MLKIQLYRPWMHHPIPIQWTAVRMQDVVTATTAMPALTTSVIKLQENASQ